MIWLAVRVENALPSDERYAPVTAFAIAANSDGKLLTPSSPPVAPVPEVIVNVGAAPVILNTPSTLPTRSTTAIVALAPRACASNTACAMTSCTSETVNAFGEAASQLPLHPPEPEPPPPPPPQPASNASAAQARTHDGKLLLVIALFPKSCEAAAMSDGWRL